MNDSVTIQSINQRSLIVATHQKLPLEHCAILAYYVKYLMT